MLPGKSHRLLGTALVVSAIVGALAGWDACALAQAKGDASPLVDFDGDGRVTEAEKLGFEIWQKDLPSLASDALAAGSVTADGIIDISDFLQERSNSTLQRDGAQMGTPTIGQSTLDPCVFLRGDANRDWQIDVADLVFILSYLSGGTPPKHLDSADTNDDGGFDVADYVYLSSYLFDQGPPPPAPYPDPGLDPTFDNQEEQCMDRGGFEHPTWSHTLNEMPLAPIETAPQTGSEPHPSGCTEPSDATGGFTGIAPELPVFPGPGGLAWGHRISYKTRYADRDILSCSAELNCDTVQGVGWFGGIPYVIDAGESAEWRYWVRWSADSIRAYSLIPGETTKYSGRHLNRTLLAHEGDELILYDVGGRKYVFYDMEQNTAIRKGRLKRIEGLGDAVIELTWSGTGRLTQVEMKTSPTAQACQRWVYSYSTGGANKGRLLSVEFQRPEGDPPSYHKAMVITFRYFDPGSGEVGGTTGDLMEIEVRTRTSRSGLDTDELNWLRKTYYYRYWSGPFDEGALRSGSEHQVKWIFGPDSCAQLPANYQTTADLSGYTDSEYAYCRDRRLKELEVFGYGCCGGGLSGVYNYTWFLGQETSADLSNTLHSRVQIVLPNGTARIIDHNAYGQKLFNATQVNPPTGLVWVTRAYYDDVGGELLDLYHPSICSSYSYAGTALPCNDECPAYGGSQLVTYQASVDTGLRHEFGYTDTVDHFSFYRKL